MATRKTVDLRTYVTNAFKSIPARNRRNPETRLDLVRQAVSDARRGQIRRVDGGRYTPESVRCNVYKIYRELVG